MRIARSSTYRRLAATGTALVLAVALAACGGDGSDGSDEGSTAGATSPATSSASPSGSSDASDPGVTEETGGDSSAGDRISQVEAASQEAGTARLEMTVVISGGGQEQEISATGAFDFSDGAMQIDMEMPGAGKLGLLMFDDAMYLRGLPNQPADKWAKIPTEQADSLGLDFSQADPSQSLGLLQGVSDDVREDGTETIRGIETTKYVGTIDLKKAAAELARVQGDEAAAEAQKMLESSGVETVPFELYLDDQNRPVRMVQNIEMSSGTESLTTATTLEMFDWGADLGLEAPAEGDLIDLDMGGPAPSTAPTTS